MVAETTSQRGYEAFRAHWGNLVSKPGCSPDEAYRLFMAGAKWQRDQTPTPQVQVVEVPVSSGTSHMERLALADELEAAARTETQSARETLYRQLVTRLRGGE